MDMEVLDAWFVEQALDSSVEQTSVDHIGIDHQPTSILGANGQGPRAEQLRHLVDAHMSLLGILANEDRARRAVR